jgi:hypothetical protein
LKEFFEREQVNGGWRFWALWVVATNLGFFPGLLLGNQIGGAFEEPIRGAILACCFGFLSGATQWLVLRRHVAQSFEWVIATGVGWTVGAGVAEFVFLFLPPSLQHKGIVWVLVVGFFAGAIVGVLHTRLVRRIDPALARWWIPISALAWGLFFPGAVSGVFLARRMRAGE